MLSARLAKQKKTDTSNEDNSNENVGTGEDDEFNPTLAAMENEIKPKVLQLSLIHISEPTRPY